MLPMRARSEPSTEQAQRTWALADRSPINTSLPSLDQATGMRKLSPFMIWWSFAGSRKETTWIWYPPSLGRER